MIKLVVLFEIMASNIGAVFYIACAWFYKVMPIVALPAVLWYICNTVAVCVIFSYHPSRECAIYQTYLYFYGQDLF